MIVNFKYLTISINCIYKFRIKPIHFRTSLPNDHDDKAEIDIFITNFAVVVC